VIKRLQHLQPEIERAGHQIRFAVARGPLRITLLGNVPPRDVLAAGTPADVARAVTEMLGAFEGRSRLIPSCGGGMPPGVKSENVAAFVAAVDAVTG
jgi:uroporphyrinogen-III decarboxylase